MKYRTCLAIALTVLASVAGPVSAATYFVSPSGQDSSRQPTNISSPLYTLNAAVRLARPGDTISMRGGTYSYTTTQTISCSGSSSNWISIHSYSGETPRIDGSRLPSGNGSVIITGSNLNFAGIEVANSKDAGIRIYGSQGVYVGYCSIHNNWQAGLLVKGENLAYTAAVTVDHCTLYANGQVNASRSSGNWPGALMTQGASYVTFSNNTVFQNYGEGVIFNLCQSGHAIGNDIHDNFSVEFYLDNATNCTVEKNFIYSKFDSNYYRDGSPATGIQYANETYWFQNYDDGITIKNNVVVNCRFGFMYGNYGMGGGMRDTKLINNTFYNSLDTALLINADAGHRNTSICNNIFSQTGNHTLAYSDGGGTIWYYHNVWSGGNWNNGGLYGTGDVWADPKIINPGGYSASDYALQSTSPAIQAGAADSDVTDDFFGYVRSSNDIGALAYH